MNFYSCRINYYEEDESSDVTSSFIITAKTMSKAVDILMYELDIKDEEAINTLEIHKLTPDRNVLMVSEGVLKTLENDIIW